MKKTILALALLAGAYASAKTVVYQPGSTPVQKKFCVSHGDKGTDRTCGYRTVYMTAPQYREVCTWPSVEDRKDGVGGKSCSTVYGRFQDNGTVVFESQAECVKFYTRTYSANADKADRSALDIRKRVSEKCGN